jgi:hypothetical protein
MHSERSNRNRQVVYLTIDPATVLRSKEGDDASDIIRSSTSLQGAVLGHHVLDLVSGPVGSRAGDVVPCKQKSQLVPTAISSLDLDPLWFSADNSTRTSILCEHV